MYTQVNQYMLDLGPTPTERELKGNSGSRGFRSLSNSISRRNSRSNSRSTSRSEAKPQTRSNSRSHTSNSKRTSDAQEGRARHHSANGVLSSAAPAAAEASGSQQACDPQQSADSSLSSAAPVAAGASSSQQACNQQQSADSSLAVAPATANGSSAQEGRGQDQHVDDALHAGLVPAKELRPEADPDERIRVVRLSITVASSRRPPRSRASLDGEPRAVSLSITAGTPLSIWRSQKDVGLLAGTPAPVPVPGVDGVGPTRTMLARMRSWWRPVPRPPRLTMPPAVWAAIGLEENVASGWVMKRGSDAPYNWHERFLAVDSSTSRLYYYQAVLGGCVLRGQMRIFSATPLPRAPLFTCLVEPVLKIRSKERDEAKRRKTIVIRPASIADRDRESVVSERPSRCHTLRRRSLRKMRDFAAHSP